MIDEVLPPEDHEVVHEVNQLIIPQLAIIATQTALLKENNGYNCHHLMYPRRDYSTPLEKQFRRQLILPVDIEVHRELHALLKPPTKPSREIMLGYLAVLDRQR